MGQLGDQFFVGGISGADEQFSLCHKYRPQLLEFWHGMYPGPEFHLFQRAAGHGALGGLKGQIVDEQPEQILIPDGHGLNGFRVDVHNLLETFRIVPGQFRQINADGLGEFLPGKIQLLIFIKIFPGSGGAQSLGVQEAPQEKGPGGKEGVSLFRQQHLLEVNPVPVFDAGPGPVGKDIGDAADMGRLNGNGVQEFVSEQPLAKGQKLAPADFRKVLRDGVQPFRVSGQIHGDGQRKAVILHQFPHGAGLEVIFCAGLGGQQNAGALGAVFQGFQGVGAVGPAGPDVSRASGGAGMDLDGVRHHEAGQQANAETANEILGNSAVHQLGFRGLTDHRQKTVNSLLVQSRAVVLKAHPASRFQGNGDLPARPAGGLLLPQRNGVHAVLQQLS